MSLSVKHSNAFDMSLPKRLLRWEDGTLYGIVSMNMLCLLCLSWTSIKLLQKATGLL